ncbi:hypothetical protein [Coralloluteibacterium stylophorae]|uniref:Uncharacterized protein n=1 Tax=Coralloluteibacterium stylophorae TaxID=1776034 RepID=A0A8J7VSU2_9GAMM|nr:hypothetical protein [Coralloluteibacterium stylophorae]MBS7457714.1 hypothetical protein [Coralloluteibacterium stylophorae]
MNLDRLDTLARWLEDGAKHERITFDMTKGIAIKTTELFDPEKPTECGSSCCIAGAAVQFFGDLSDLDPYMVARRLEEERRYGDDAEEEVQFRWGDIMDDAAELLGLTPGQARALFEPGMHPIWPYTYEEYNDPAWAARTIRHLMATGEVSWAATEKQA